MLSCPGLSPAWSPSPPPSPRSLRSRRRPLAFPGRSLPQPARRASGRLGRRRRRRERAFPAASRRQPPPPPRSCSVLGLPGSLRSVASGPSRSAQHAPGHPPPRPLPLVPARSPRLPPGDVHRPSAGSPCWGLCGDGLVRRRHGCSCCPCRRHRRINHLRRQPTRQKVLRCQARAPSSHTSQAALDARSVAPPLPCSRLRYPPHSCCLTCHGSLPLHPSPVG